MQDRSYKKHHPQKKEEVKKSKCKGHTSRKVKKKNTKKKQENRRKRWGKTAGIETEGKTKKSDQF